MIPILLGLLAALAAGSPGGEPALQVVVEDPLSIVAGEDDTLELPLEVAEGLHVQANPASQEFLIPLEVETRPGEGLRTGDALYPEPVRWRLEGTEDDLLVYGERFTVSIPVRAEAPGTYTLPLTVRYQACTDRMCLFPDSLVTGIEILARNP